MKLIFREPEEICNILESFSLNDKMELHLVTIFQKLLEIFEDYSFETEQQKSRINFAINTVGLEDKEDSFVKLSKTILKGIAPGEHIMKSDLVTEFLDYILSLPVHEQVGAYKVLGNELNKVLYGQTKRSPNIQQVDLQQLLNTSHTKLYETADPRLKAFIEAAVRPVNTHENMEIRNTKRNVFCANILEISFLGVGLGVCGVAREGFWVGAENYFDKRIFTTI